MRSEAKKVRAQYLNGIAIAILSAAGAALLAGQPLWVLVLALVASLAIHAAAILTVTR
jgi:hypothetical protein